MSTPPEMTDRPKLTAYERECLIERAAIIEYCGNVPRAEAERLAKQQLEEQRNKDLVRWALETR